VVLEIPWLREENPVIDWRKETISLIEERVKIGMVSIKGLLNRNEKKVRKKSIHDDKGYKERKSSFQENHTNFGRIRTEGIQITGPWPIGLSDRSSKKELGHRNRTSENTPEGALELICS
jgi:hypothetical protein